MFGRILGPTSDEVTEGWRKLHSEELRDLYSSTSIITMIKSRGGGIRWKGGHVARKGENRNAYRLVIRKPEGKRTLGEQRRRWMDNIRIGFGGVDWIGLAEDRGKWRALVNTVMNLRFPYNAAKLWSNAQLHRVSFFFFKAFHLLDRTVQKNENTQT
jgi:hypothetical protein